MTTSTSPGVSVASGAGVEGSGSGSITGVVSSAGWWSAGVSSCSLRAGSGSGAMGTSVFPGFRFGGDRFRFRVDGYVGIARRFGNLMGGFGAGGDNNFHFTRSCFTSERGLFTRFRVVRSRSRCLSLGGRFCSGGCPFLLCSTIRCFCKIFLGRFFGGCFPLRQGMR